MKEDSLKSILFQNISNQGVSIDYLYDIIERENYKRASGEKKLRDLSAEGKIEAKRKDKDSVEHWETWHNPLNNHTITGYRRKDIPIKDPKFKMAFKPARLFALSPVRG